MIRVLCMTVLFGLGALAAQDAGQPAKTRELSPRELARQAARAIKEAAKGDDVDAILTALQEGGRLDDTDVVRTVGTLVDDEREKVQWAAVLCLRYNPNAKAGSELISAAKNKKVLASEALTAEVLRGIGQHSDPRALDLLAEGFGPVKEAEILTNARIDAVGRIQTAEAVDTLIKFARSGFAKGKDERVCTALAGQTGENQGTEMRGWVLWWNRAKLGYRFPEHPATPPAAWTRLWEEPSNERLFDRIPGSGREPTESAPETPRRRGRDGAGGGDAAGGRTRGGDTGGTGTGRTRGGDGSATSGSTGKPRGGSGG